jgi:putative membrane protein
MDRWDMMDGFNGTGSLWLLLAVVLIGVVVVISVWLIVRSQREVTPPTSTAMDILRERFARGEITQEEFEAARKALGG